MSEYVLEQHLCPECGADLKSIGKDEYVCKYCGKGPFTYKRIENDFLSGVSSLIDKSAYNAKNEQLANLRKRLYELTRKAEYCDSDAIKRVCEEIKKIMPEDFLADFYLVANGGNKKEVNAFIEDIDVEKHFDSIDWVIEFMLRSLKSEYVTSVSYLIEKAKLYSEQNDKDEEIFVRLVDRFEQEARKVSKGIYDVDMPRDVFVAYSSKDIDIAYKVVEALEANDMQCFFAIRNLQNGANAINNYNANIRKAIDNSTVFLFISTENSRTKGCDAFGIELNYILNTELAKLGVMHGVYEKLGIESGKKPRIEYLVDKYNGTSIYENTVKTFFKGYTYCKDIASLPNMVYTAIQEKQAADYSRIMSPKNTPQQPAKVEVKEKVVIICPHCGGKNNSEAKFCSSCGKSLTVTVKEDKPDTETVKKPQEADQIIVKESSEAVRKEDKTSSGTSAAAPQNYYDKRVAQLAKNGFAGEWGGGKAQYTLGLAYYYGKGVEQSYEKAVKQYKLSADLGNADAQNALGDCYYYGYGVAQDYKKAVEWFTKSAEQGNADAQKTLGVCYYKGNGVEQNYEKAVEWYTKSAEQGNADAQNNLGYCYESGKGVAQDYKKAVEWYTKSAEQGNAAAQGNLGLCYYFGEGVAQSYEKAVEWYKKSAERGNAYGQSKLGDCYYFGDGVAQNYEKAVEWYKKSAEQGNFGAIDQLSECYKYGYGVEKNENIAKELEKAYNGKKPYQEVMEMIKKL